MEDSYALLRLGAFSGIALSDEDRRWLDARLWDALKEQTERYTMNASSSVPFETAAALLQSIQFSLGVAANSSDDAQLHIRSGNMTGLLKLARSAVEREVETGKALFQSVMQTSPKVKNRAYRDTIKEIRHFFKYYDPFFFAHDIPCSIDYQLSEPVPESLEGILYVNEYLRRLLVENMVLQLFNPSTVAALLEEISPDHAEHLMNIFEPVLANAFGRALLRMPAADLDISDADRAELARIFGERPTVGFLTDAADRLNASLALTEAYSTDYVKKAVQNLLPRVYEAAAANHLERVFLSLYRTTELKAPRHLVDQEMMDGERLRALIEEISDYRFVSDKAAALKREVRSLRDACEILSVCFYEDDSIAYYKMLSVDELALLLLYSGEKRLTEPEWSSESGWEKNLEQYVSSLDAPGQAELRQSIQRMA